MRLLVCVILPLVAWCAPAVSVNEESIPAEGLKPLTRMKRADEEVLYGNHQNEARVVKKADPSLRLIDDEAMINNNKADSPEHTQTSDVMKTGSDDNLDVNSIFSEDAKSVGDLTEDEDGDGEEKSEVDDDTPDESSFTSSEADTSGEVPIEENVMDGDKDVNYKDYKDYYDYFYPNLGIGRYRRNIKQKRAVPQKLLTADNMIMESSEKSRVGPNQRYKRDLAADELAEWFENGDASRGAEDVPSLGYYPEYEADDVGRDDTIQNLALEQLLDQGYPGEMTDNVDYPLYEDKMEDEEDPEKTRELLSLLEYLEGEAPNEQTRDVGDSYPDDIQEKWEDLDMDPDIPYEPIIYNGVRGVFIPMDGKASTPEIQKRQYLSMMPGMRKRGFQYPYNLEPEGGRWGAFVAPREEKRQAESYERLYRLAEALNDGNREYFK